MAGASLALTHREPRISDEKEKTPALATSAVSALPIKAKDQSQILLVGKTDLKFIL